MANIWQLQHQGLTVAELEVVDSDFPWLRAIVHPRAGFDSVASLFREELLQLDATIDRDDDSPEWIAAYEAVRAQTALLDPHGNSVPEYLLHIDGDQAWWRWHDKPFSDKNG